MAALSKQYSVQYNITANATKAAETINAFKKNVESIAASTQVVTEAITKIQTSIRTISETPLKLNLTDFERQLKTMEAAVKVTATRISQAIANAFNGKGVKGNPFIGNLKGNSFLKGQIAALAEEEKALRAAASKAQKAVTKGDTSALAAEKESKAVKAWKAKRDELNKLRAQLAKETGKDTVTQAKNAAKAINTVNQTTAAIDRNGIVALNKLMDALKNLNKVPRSMKFSISASVSGLKGVMEMANAISTINSYTKSAARAQAKAAGGKSGSGGTKASVQVAAPPLPQTPTATATATSKRPYTRPTTTTYRSEIPIRARVDRTAVDGDLRSSLVNSQNILNSRPLLLPIKIDRTTIGGELRSMLINSQNILNSRPLKVPVLIEAKAPTAATGTKASTTVTTTSKATAAASTTKALTKAIQSSVPGTGAGKGGNAQIKLELDTKSAQAQLRSFLSQVRSSSPQVIRIVTETSAAGAKGTTNTIVGNTGRIARTSGVSYSRGYDPTTSYMVSQKARWYPLTGNTSLGANTPMLVDMAKGMGTMMAIGGAMSAVSNSIHQSFEYENIMETARAILKNNSSGGGAGFNSDFREMEEIVREVGVKTKFTAPEVAGAAKYLAMAGLDVGTIKSSIRPVANVALAGDLDLATTADKLTNIMTAFNMDASQIANLSDMLVNTFTRSNTSMMQLAEASQYAAPLANTYGMSINEMLALMGVMGNAGIQGSMAGTSLRMIMQNIVKPSKNQQVWWDTMNVSRFNADGTPRSVTAIMQDIAKSVPMEKLIQPIMGTFRVTSAAAAAQIVKNLQTVDDIAKSNLESGGLAERVGVAKQNTVQGIMAQVKSTFTEGILRGVEGNQDKIKEMLSSFRDFFAKPETIQSLGRLVELFMDLMKIIMQMTKVMTSLYDVFGPVLMLMWKLQLWFTMFGGMIKMFLGVFNSFASLGANMGLFASGTAGVLGGAGAKAAMAGGASAAIRRTASTAAAQTASALTFGGMAAADALAMHRDKQWRYERLANRLNYAHDMQVLSNPDEKYRINQQAHARNRALMMAERHGREARNISAAMAFQNTLSTMRAERAERIRKYNINQAAKNRHANRVVSSSTLNRAVKMGKISGGTARGIAFSQNFRSAATWGMTGLSSAFSLTGIVGGLSKLLGALVNPITLTIGAFTGLYLGIRDYIKKRDESIRTYNNLERKAHEAMALTHAAAEVHLDTGSKFEAVTLQNREMPKFKRSVPTFSNDERFAQFYAENATATAGKAKNAYDEYYKPYYRLLYGKEAPEYDSLPKTDGLALWGYGTKTTTTRNHYDISRQSDKTTTTTTILDPELAEIYKKNFGIMGIGDDEMAKGRYYQAVARPYISAIESDAYKRTVKQMHDIAEELANARKSGRQVKFEDYYDRMYDLAKPYSTYNKYPEASLEDKTSRFNDYTDIFYTRETQAILYNKLLEIANQFRDTYTEGADALEMFNKFDFIKSSILEQLSVIGQLVGTVPVMVTDANGMVHRLYVGLSESGTVDIQAFHAMLTRMGITFQDTAYNNTMLLIDIIEKIKKMPGMAAKFTKDMYELLLKSANGKTLFFNEGRSYYKNLFGNLGYGPNTLDMEHEFLAAGAKAMGMEDKEDQTRYINSLKDNKGILNQMMKPIKNIKLNQLWNAGAKAIVSGDYQGSTGQNITIDEDVTTNENGDGGGNGGGNKFKPFTTPSAVKKNNDQQKYGNHYSRQAARPTQINITIGSLANFDKTFIAKNAEEREMVEAMENKMAEAISMLTSQLSSQLSVVAENASA